MAGLCEGGNESLGSLTANKYLLKYWAPVLRHLVYTIHAIFPHTSVNTSCSNLEITPNSGKHVTPEMVRPYPKTKPKKLQNRGRPKCKSRILPKTLDKDKIQEWEILKAEQVKRKNWLLKRHRETSVRKHFKYNDPNAKSNIVCSYGLDMHLEGENKRSNCSVADLLLNDVVNLDRNFIKMTLRNFEEAAPIQNDDVRVLRYEKGQIFVKTAYTGSSIEFEVLNPGIRNANKIDTAMELKF
ncbi:hypothetical protein ANN_16176, partial [Periplaneta americana]